MSIGNFSSSYPVLVAKEQCLLGADFLTHNGLCS